MSDCTCEHKNIYKPAMMRISSVREETPDVKTFRLEFINSADRDFFQSKFRTGMFGMYGLFGEGECPFCVASPETRKDYIECTFRNTGRVTSALALADLGDIVSFRGPYGNFFPLDKFEGKNLIFIAGGIALPPTRSVIVSCLDERAKYGKITILYGARTVSDLVYKEELENWKKRTDVNLTLTVDPGGETPDWRGKIGFVPSVFEEIAPSPENAVVVMCGPPIMIKFTLVALNKLGFDPTNVYTTLENRMKCGIGKCGRCNIGSTYVCKDGPVFTAADLSKLPVSDF